MISKAPPPLHFPPATAVPYKWTLRVFKGGVGYDSQKLIDSVKGPVRRVLTPSLRPFVRQRLNLFCATQRCGTAVPPEGGGGGVASPVSVLTRGSVRGAPFLTKSVLISTF